MGKFEFRFWTATADTTLVISASSVSEAINKLPNHITDIDISLTTELSRVDINKVKTDDTYGDVIGSEKLQSIDVTGTELQNVQVLLQNNSY